MLVQYYDELLAYFVRRVDDRHEAQDLVQETFERVLTKVQAGLHVGQARALLFEVARNMLVDRYRFLRVRKHDGDELLSSMAGPPSSDPEAVYASRQRVHVMIAVLDQLAPRCRTAFLLHKVQGKSHAEVAQLMGISVATVERHIMLALAACRKALH